MTTQPVFEPIFYYRVAGVAVTETHVLLHRSEIDDFWALPGGRVELGEASTAALVRELQEEMDARVVVERLLWVVENFFTYQQYQVHELGLYYLIQLPDETRLQAPRFTGIERDQSIGPREFKLDFRWFPRQEPLLRALPVLPVFLQQGLVDLPEATLHLVNDER
jgi:ADP-ribose pyrophosphatase YjhB (NUDIX family)